MVNCDHPRRGTAAANAVGALHSIGGTASIRTLMKVTGTKKTRAEFCQSVVDRLVRSSLVNEVGDELQLTDEGKRYLGHIAKPEEAPAGPVVAPRYVHPIQPLNLRRHRPARVIRDGSLDFRAAPSLIGDQVVAYKGPGGFAGATNPLASESKYN
jgi:hypothetical protein